MRQRAAIAMALACKPEGAPRGRADDRARRDGAGADPRSSSSALADDFGLALILVTHDLPVVAQVCERAAVMYAGEIVEDGPTDTLYHDPRHPYTRLLFAATPDLYGEDAVVSIPGTPPRLDRELVGCPFAPRCDRAFAPVRDGRSRDCSRSARATRPRAT